MNILQPITTNCVKTWALNKIEENTDRNSEVEQPC